VRERLNSWAKEFKNLGERIIDDAMETAEWCYLAFAVFEQGADIETGYPNEALISVTKFGVRPSHRPPTAQPAMYAAYYLQQKGIDRAAVHSFVEGLLGRTLGQSELRKHMSPIRKKLKQAAETVYEVTMNGVSERTLKKEVESLEETIAGINGHDNRTLIQHMHQLAANRFPLLQQIKLGEFKHSPPLMVIGQLKVLGRATLSTVGEGVTVLFPHLPLEPTGRPRGAFICSVPAWYPQWQGGF